MNQTGPSDSSVADPAEQSDQLFGDYIETAEAYRIAVAQWAQLSGPKRKAFAATVEEARFRADHAYKLWRESRRTTV